MRVSLLTVQVAESELTASPKLPSRQLLQQKSRSSIRMALFALLGRQVDERLRIASIYKM